MRARVLGAVVGGGCLAVLAAAAALDAWLPKVYARHAWLTSVDFGVDGRTVDRR